MFDRTARTDFVKAFASRSNLSDQWAAFGFIQLGEKYLLALPCSCDAKDCAGWQMVGPDAAPDIAEELSARLAQMERSE